MRTAILPLLIVITSCSTNRSELGPRTSIPPPTGAKIEPSGFATIRRAPPAPYNPPERALVGWEALLPPGETRLPTDDVEILQHRWERRIPLAQARAEIMQLRADAADAQAVAARARATEPDNFVQLSIQRSPVAAWKFAFKRNPQESLARYTDNPRFVAVRGGYTDEEVEALWAEWWPKLEPFSAIAGRGPEGLTFEMKMTEQEFRALPQFRDFEPPPGVKIEFPKEPGLPRATPDAAPFVRIFPQQRFFPGIILTGGRVHRGDARITLRDGCLFLGDSLVRLNRTMGLFRDEQGYLALRDRAELSKPHVRIGERITGGGGYSEPIDDATRKWITSHCGDHPIVDLYSPNSLVNWPKYIDAQYSPTPSPESP